MNRRNFIRTAAAGVVGILTGWGLLKSKPLPKSFKVNSDYYYDGILMHGSDGRGTLYDANTDGPALCQVIREDGVVTCYHLRSDGTRKDKWAWKIKDNAFIYSKGYVHYEKP